MLTAWARWVFKQAKEHTGSRQIGLLTIHYSRSVEQLKEVQVLYTNPSENVSDKREAGVYKENKISKQWPLSRAF